MGTIGNVLSVPVMMKKKNRKYATSWFITIVSFSDTLFLFSTIPWGIIYHYSYETVDISVYARCTLDYFTYYFSFEYSAWMLVLMAIERFISVVYPTKAKSIATPRKAKQICLLLALILGAINLYHLTNHEVVDWNGISYCEIRPEHTYVMNNVWTIVDAVIYCYLPSLLMFTFNGIIIYHMWSAKSQSVLNEPSTISKSFSRVTRMLLSVSFFFICTTLPVETMFIVLSRSESHNKSVYACLDVLMVLNHSANFYLYCVSTKKFRQDLKNMYCIHKVHPSDANTSTLQPTAPAN